MSWQLRLLNAQLRLITKRRIGRTASPQEAALQVERSSQLAWVPPYLRVFERPGGLTWVACGTCKSGKAILWFHGGGYISGSPWTHRAMLGALSCDAQVEVCAPRYPLLQEARFPAQFEAAVTAWDRLRAQGYHPRDIVLGGDSAGGGLALALLGALCRRGERPTGAVVFSPWTDLALTGASLRENADSDPLLPPERIGDLATLFLDGADPTDPRASPLYADFPDCPPVFLAWAETEILRDDCARMAERLRGFGARVETEVHPTAPHVWPLFQGWVPEGRATLKRAARFVQTSFAAISR
ncbi:alpha/beta hydrolase fold domain-containing protein [Sagittula salina]|uniref:Alpha/beta hydrolase n=1 Tax=Sagittula salina TaxID=2820268 RepID=A0A940RZQ2_9RHOB|nr:alpha/beta hydrolase fold domain-containing protein [Sagittula salina]MBP0482223.1 alpha/beta hydrolase [Sagittula salina]